MDFASVWIDEADPILPSDTIHVTCTSTTAATGSLRIAGHRQNALRYYMNTMLASEPMINHINQDEFQRMYLAEWDDPLPPNTRPDDVIYVRTLTEPIIHPFPNFQRMELLDRLRVPTPTLEASVEEINDSTPGSVASTPEPVPCALGVATTPPEDQRLTMAETLLAGASGRSLVLSPENVHPKSEPMDYSVIDLIYPMTQGYNMEDNIATVVVHREMFPAYFEKTLKIPKGELDMFVVQYRFGQPSMRIVDRGRLANELRNDLAIQFASFITGRAIMDIAHEIYTEAGWPFSVSGIWPTPSWEATVEQLNDEDYESLIEEYNVKLMDKCCKILSAWFREHNLPGEIGKELHML